MHAGLFRGAVIVACVVFTHGGSARANDATFGGSGAQLAPLSETRIRMAAEEVVLTLRRVSEGEEPGDGLAWHVDATYRFDNPTDAEVEVHMGFPEPSCAVDGCDPAETRFTDLVTTVRGEEVEQRTGTVAPLDGWEESIGRVFLYDVTFAPGETIEVHHSYTYPGSREFVGRWADYITRTGTLWNGPIGHAKFVIRTPLHPFLATVSPGFEVSSYAERVTDEGTITELTLEMSEWTPTHDLKVYLLDDWRGGMDTMQMTDLECPNPFWPAQCAEDTATLDANALRVCRAGIWAHHGRPFDDSALGARFYRTEPTEDEAGLIDFGDEQHTLLLPRANAEYTADLLSESERQCIAAIEERLASLTLPEESTSAPIAEPAASRDGTCGCRVGASSERTPWLAGAFVMLIAMMRLRRRAGP